MGLDATVYCDCFERGRLRTPPLPQWNVYVDESGERFCDTDSLDEDLAFDVWNLTACEHDRGAFLHQYLGNTTRVGLVRAALSRHAEWFPILLSRVVYDGVHAETCLSFRKSRRCARRSRRWRTCCPAMRGRPIAYGTSISR